MEETIVRLIWGKTKNRDSKATEFHPLLFHLLDVANAARGLWQLLPTRIRQRIARALGVSEKEAERVVVLLAGIHDLGKASAFQTKAEFLWQSLKAAGFGKPTKEELHSFVTAYRDVLPKLLQETKFCGWSVRKAPMANTLAAITGAHHGTFPSPIQTMSSLTLGDEKWSRARSELARMLAETLREEGDTPEHISIDGSQLTDLGVGAFLTGLISVADWIGSASQHFLTDSQNRTIAEYAPLSRDRARQAMTDFGWLSTPEFRAAIPFHEMIWDTDKDETPVRFPPNDLQKIVAKYAVAANGRPYLLIAEAAMGEGKTEAALYAVDHGLSTGANPGFYVGLPTQATGNALFRRVLAYLRYRGHEGKLNLQLVHSGADFNNDYEGLRAASYKKPLANGTAENQRVVAESWFSSRKQALLARFGVGTIDQSLTGVLQTKHWFVRLFGLAGKVVVFDEVHAYDVYMSELLETLIGWLAELDCTVILLSATLPSARREALMRAYRGDATVKAAPYPRVTFIPREGDGIASETVPGSKPPRTVALSFAKAQGDVLAKRIAADLPGGGCAAIICNTVAQAQGYYQVLKDDPVLQKDGWTVSLFHARTPLDWRLARENDVVERFGKKSGPAERDRQILIATQVVEQSLDIDFDWMASEMAPVDLLLQRMGRLWRHARASRPAAEARFVVLADAGEPGEPGDALPVFPPCSDLIYSAYTLLRSYLVIRNRTKIVLPDDIETLVNDAYDGEPESPDAVWSQALTAAKNELLADQAKDKRTAEGNLISLADHSDFQTLFTSLQRTLVDDDNPEVHKTMRAVTRLGDPSVTLICLRKDSDGSLRPFCAPLDAAPVLIGNDDTKEPQKKQVKLLRESSLSLSRPRALYYHLLHQELPAAWKDNSHLRYARSLIFKNGECKVETKKETITLRLDPATGLSIVREQALEESSARESAPERLSD